MKKLLLVFVGLLCSLVISAQTNFQELSLEKAREQARAENKPIFLDCYTSWCGPCRCISEEVLQTPEAAKYFDKYFVCFKVDAEKGEGVAFADKYDVHAYPTFLMILPDGTLRHKIVGADTLHIFIPRVERGIERENFVGVFYEKILGWDFAEKRDSAGCGCVPGSRDERRGEKLDGFFVRIVIAERKIGSPLLGGL